MRIITLKYTEILILLTLAVFSDIKTYKIKNIITLPFIGIGIITNLLLFGFGEISTSFYGIIVPFLVLMPLHLLRMLGAGDIKLFCAIGSIMGLEFAAFSMAYSFLAGGVISFFLIVIRKNGKKRLLHLLRYLKSCFLTFSIGPYTDFEDKSDGAKFHFAIAIAVGTLARLLEKMLN